MAVLHTFQLSLVCECVFLSNTDFFFTSSYVIFFTPLCGSTPAFKASDFHRMPFWFGFTDESVIEFSQQHWDRSWANITKLQSFNWLFFAYICSQKPQPNPKYRGFGEIGWHLWPFSCLCSVAAFANEHNSSVLWWFGYICNFWLSVLLV